MCTCTHDQKMAFHGNRQQASSVAVMSSVQVINMLSVRGSVRFDEHSFRA